MASYNTQFTTYAAPIEFSSIGALGISCINPVETNGVNYNAINSPSAVSNPVVAITTSVSGFYINAVLPPIAISSYMVTDKFMGANIVTATSYLMRAYDSVNGQYVFWTTSDPSAIPTATNPAFSNAGNLVEKSIVNVIK